MWKIERLGAHRKHALYSAVGQLLEYGYLTDYLSEAAWCDVYTSLCILGGFFLRHRRSLPKRSRCLLCVLVHSVRWSVSIIPFCCLSASLRENDRKRSHQQAETSSSWMAAPRCTRGKVCWWSQLGWLAFRLSANQSKGNGFFLWQTSTQQ